MKDWVTGPSESDRWNWTTGIVPSESGHWNWTTRTRFGNKIAPIEAQPIAQPVPISILSHLESGNANDGGESALHPDISPASVAEGQVQPGLKRSDSAPGG